MTVWYDQEDGRLMGTGRDAMQSAKCRVQNAKRGGDRYEAGRLIARVVAGVVIGSFVALVLGVIVQLGIWAIAGVQG